MRTSAYGLSGPVFRLPATPAQSRANAWGSHRPVRFVDRASHDEFLRELATLSQQTLVSETPFSRALFTFLLDVVVGLGVLAILVATRMSFGEDVGFMMMGTGLLLVVAGSSLHAFSRFRATSQLKIIEQGYFRKRSSASNLSTSGG